MTAHRPSRILHWAITIAAFGVIAGTLIAARSFERAPAPVEERIELTNGYRDGEFGFTLRFPASWEGMTVARRSVRWAGTGDVPTVDFWLSAEERTVLMFSVHVMTREAWEAARDPALRKLGEDGATVFAATVNAEVASPTVVLGVTMEKPASIIVRGADIDTILQSFESPQS